MVIEINIFNWQFEVKPGTYFSVAPQFVLAKCMSFVQTAKYTDWDLISASIRQFVDGNVRAFAFIFVFLLQHDSWKPQLPKTPARGRG